MLGVRDLILRSLTAGRVVITAPADTLPELAHILAALLDRELRAKRVTCVLTCSPGAVPEGGCPPTNIQTAIEASLQSLHQPKLASPLAPPSIALSMQRFRWRTRGTNPCRRQGPATPRHPSNNTVAFLIIHSTARPCARRPPVESQCLAPSQSWHGDLAACLPACLPAILKHKRVCAAPQVASDTMTAPDFGVLVYADGLVHAGRQVLGADPWHGGCFRSHPGPVGEVRGGQTVSLPSDPADVRSQVHEGHGRIQRQFRSVGHFEVIREIVVDPSCFSHDDAVYCVLVVNVLPLRVMTLVYPDPLACRPGVLQRPAIAAWREPDPWRRLQRAGAERAQGCRVRVAAHAVDVPAAGQRHGPP